MYSASIFKSVFVSSFYNDQLFSIFLINFIFMSLSKGNGTLSVSICSCFYFQSLTLVSTGHMFLAHLAKGIYNLLLWNLLAKWTETW
jgi:hypothetical protein